MVHTENLNLTTAIFDNGARQTYFSGSYNELRDKPTIPAAGDPTPSWVKETQNLVALSGFNTDLEWIDIQNQPAWISSAQSVINLSGFNNDMGSKRILNVATPTASTDAATKAYVDSMTQSLIDTYAELYAPMGSGAIEGRVQSGVMSFRLRNYKLPKLSGITVNSATFLFAVFDFNLLFVSRQEVSVTISEWKA